MLAAAKPRFLSWRTRSGDGGASALVAGTRRCRRRRVVDDDDLEVRPLGPRVEALEAEAVQLAVVEGDDDDRELREESGNLLARQRRFELSQERPGTPLAQPLRDRHPGGLLHEREGRAERLVPAERVHGHKERLVFSGVPGRLQRHLCEAAGARRDRIRGAVRANVAELAGDSGRRGALPPPGAPRVSTAPAARGPRGPLRRRGRRRAGSRSPGRERRPPPRARGCGRPSPRSPRNGGSGRASRAAKRRALQYPFAAFHTREPWISWSSPRTRESSSASRSRSPAGAVVLVLQRRPRGARLLEEPLPLFHRAAKLHGLSPERRGGSDVGGDRLREKGALGFRDGRRREGSLEERGGRRHVVLREARQPGRGLREAGAQVPLRPRARSPSWPGGPSRRAIRAARGGRGGRAAQERGAPSRRSRCRRAAPRRRRRRRRRAAASRRPGRRRRGGRVSRKGRGAREARTARGRGGPEAGPSRAPRRWHRPRPPASFLERNEEEASPRSSRSGGRARRPPPPPRTAPGPRRAPTAASATATSAIATTSESASTPASRSRSAADRRAGASAKAAVGGDRDPFRLDARSDQEIARRRVADRQERGGLAHAAHHPPGLRRGERADAEPDERERFALEGRQDGGSGVEADAVVVGRQEAGRVDSPVVLEEAAAPDEDEVAVPRGARDRREVAPGDRLDAVAALRVGGISRDHDGAGRRRMRVQSVQDGREDRLVAGVAEAVVAGDEDARVGRLAVTAAV